MHRRAAVLRQTARPAPALRRRLRRRARPPPPPPTHPGAGGRAQGGTGRARAGLREPNGRHRTRCRTGGPGGSGNAMPAHAAAIRIGIGEGGRAPGGHCRSGLWRAARPQACQDARRSGGCDRARPGAGECRAAGAGMPARLRPVPILRIRPGVGSDARPLPAPAERGSTESGRALGTCRCGVAGGRGACGRGIPSDRSRGRAAPGVAGLRSVIPARSSFPPPRAPTHHPHTGVTDVTPPLTAPHPRPTLRLSGT